MGRMLLAARIDRVEVLPVEELWSQYQDKLCLAREDFLSYSAGRVTLAAIVLSDVRQLSSPWRLEDLRAVDPLFRPPQFYRRLSVENPLLTELANSLVDVT